MDSYKKVRYSDFIFMLKIRSDKTILSEDVREHVFVSNPDDEDIIDPKILQIQDQLIENLIPMEVKITKSKDSKKDITKYALFCKQNLRIYNNVNEYIADARKIEVSSAALDRDITRLSDLIISSVAEDDNLEMFGNVTSFKE